ncbi:MAG TPA: hypothetical protein VN622_11120 [Clostridia bacterium]|nr:hypothetical protein [Clostridia bacterium]
MGDNPVLNANRIPTARPLTPPETPHPIVQLEDLYKASPDLLAVARLILEVRSKDEFDWKFAIIREVALSAIAKAEGRR